MTKNYVHSERAIEELDEPFEGDFSTDETLTKTQKDLSIVKENNKHERNKKILDLASMLIVISLAMLLIIWLVSVWLSPEQQKFSAIFIDILKTVILTTIGFICGHKLEN